MIIEGRYGSYNVIWKNVGWSWAHAMVRKKARFLFFFIRYINLWETSHYNCKYVGIGQMTFDDASKLHKDKMIEWFEYAVEEYERYIDSCDGDS